MVNRVESLLQVYECDSDMCTIFYIQYLEYNILIAKILDKNYTMEQYGIFQGASRHNQGSY